MACASFMIGSLAHSGHCRQGVRLHFKRIAIAAILVTLSATVFAQDEVVQWSAKLESARPLKPGEKMFATLVAKIEEGWHVYSISQPPGGPMTTIISVPSGQVVRARDSVVGPMPQTAYDANFEMQTEFYEGSASFQVPLIVDEGAKGGPATVVIDVLYQTCNDRTCLPPTTVHVPLKVTIAAAPAKESAKPRAAATGANPPPNSGSTVPKKSGKQVTPVGAEIIAQPTISSTPKNEPAAAPTGATPPPISPQPPPSPSPPLPRPEAQSLASFLWLAMGFGALSLLTPCVFPMIPITVSYFTGHAAASRGRAVKNALVYAVGIILTFTALGMILALAVGAGGVNLFAANPWVNLLITAIFLAFAMNLFGAFQIQIPSSVLTRLDKATSRAGGSEIIGTLLMGFTFTLTSFTCTAPFVGTLLVMAAQGRWHRPLVGMLAFSFVFALPFFFLAWMPQYLARLPKSGGWLNSVKVVMGFLEVAAAMKFLSNADLVWRWNIFTREVCLAVWVAIGVLTTLYLLGRFQMAHDTKVERVGALRITWTVITLTLTFYLLTGLFGRPLGELESFLPPETANGTSGHNANELSWIVNNYEGALKQAQQERKRVFVDFTGYTCTNCRWMEANMFSRPEVRRELEQYVRVRLYTDGEGKLYQDQQKMQQRMFGTVALPYYAILDSDGKSLATFPGLTRNAAEFEDFLGRGLK